MKYSGFRSRVLRIRCNPRSGQALTELMVGMVVVLVLVAGLLQLASIMRAHTDAMVEAREEAASLAMIELDPGMNLVSDADYIRDWHEGADERRLSRDDFSDTGNAADFQNTVVDKTVNDASGWNLLDGVPNNRISSLRSDAMVVTSFGLVKGSASESASLDTLPAFRHLIYSSDTIDVEATAWMTLCRGLY